MNPRHEYPIGQGAQSAVKLSRVRLLVLQPTPFCNLRCDYCYLPDRDSRERMSMETLEHVLRNVFASSCVGDELTVVWHSGEPMVLPVSYYREALGRVDSLKPKDLEIHHSFQSNGSTLNREWCDFIESEGLRIGLSIDGPDWLHNRHRKTRAGRGSHWLAMRGLRQLQSRDIPFHVITVLTRDSLDHPDVLFEFYRDHNIRDVGFNVEEIEGIQARSSLQFDGVEEHFRRFIATFLRLVGANPNVLSVREFDDMTACLLTAPGTTIPNPQVDPGAILSVDWQGKASTFSPELLGTSHPVYGDFRFANIATRSSRASKRSAANVVDRIVENPRFRRVHQDIQIGIKRCREECPYFSLCGGGAPGNKLFEHGSFFFHGNALLSPYSKDND